MPDIYEKDGYVVTDFRLDAPKWIQKLPSYGKWTRFLLAHGYAVVTGEKFEGDDGTMIDIIRPLDHAVAKVVDGRTFIPCLCCGTMIDQDDPFVKRRTGLVTVGGLIKTKESLVTGPKTMIVKWAPKPVSKRGTGCQNCQGRMLDAINEVGAINKERLKQAHLLGQMAIIEGQILHLKGVANEKIAKLTAKKLPQPLSARIDIFTEVEAEDL